MTTEFGHWHNIPVEKLASFIFDKSRLFQFAWYWLLFLQNLKHPDSQITVELPWQMFSQGACSKATRGHEAYFNAVFREPGACSLPNIWPSFIYFHSQDVSRHHRLRTIIWGSRACHSNTKCRHTHMPLANRPWGFFLIFFFLFSGFSEKKNYWGGNFHLSNTLVPAAPFQGMGGGRYYFDKKKIKKKKVTDGIFNHSITWNFRLSDMFSVRCYVRLIYLCVVCKMSAFLFSSLGISYYFVLPFCH